MRAAAFVLTLVLASGCYRIHYVNFSPEAAREPGAATEPVRAGRGWQHFFLYGWVPGTRSIDARVQCGGAENIDSIQTRRTALQGLAAAIAGFFINIYSPWNGAVYCKEPPRR